MGWPCEARRQPEQGRSARVRLEGRYFLHYMELHRQVDGAGPHILKSKSETPEAPPDSGCNVLYVRTDRSATAMVSVMCDGVA